MARDCNVPKSLPRLRRPLIPMSLFVACGYNFILVKLCGTTPPAARPLADPTHASPSGARSEPLPLGGSSRNAARCCRPRKRSTPRRSSVTARATERKPPGSLVGLPFHSEKRLALMNCSAAAPNCLATFSKKQGQLLPVIISEKKTVPELKRTIEAVVCERRSFTDCAAPAKVFVANGNVRRVEAADELEPDRSCAT